MYRHLLVPIDDTDLSIEVVGNAVGLAHAVGAHITFFHAVVADAAHITSPNDDSHIFTGKAGELLAKAEAAARAFGVGCDSTHVVSDQPAAAIVDAARDFGCDLVFMASHAHHCRTPGMAASDPLSAVLNAGLAALVSRVDEPGSPARVIAIIRDEHRSLAAVLHVWMDTLAQARSAGGAADPRLMRVIVRYIEILSLDLHDPNEEDHLFRRLRARTSAVNAELDELRRRHLRANQHVAALAAQVDILAATSGEAAADATRDLDDAVRSYASFVWEHLGREEGVILPAALRHLTESDWSQIEAAFVKHRGLRSDGEADTEAGRLFSEIVNTVQGRP